MDAVTIRRFRPGDAGWIVDRHGELYTRDEGFDDSFAPLVADIVADFAARHDPACERAWIAERDGHRLGCIFCVRLDPHTARVRLFLVLPGARGAGLGRRLLDTCTGFARARGYAGMRVWTHESHRAACALYRKGGWRLVSEKPVLSFGRNLVEQCWKFTF